MNLQPLLLQLPLLFISLIVGITTSDIIDDPKIGEWFYRVLVIIGLVSLSIVMYCRF